MKKIPNQWTAMNKAFNTARWINIFLCLLLGVLLTTQFLILNRPPVVVVEKNGQRKFYQGHRLKIVVGKEEIANFIKEFVKAYYSFNSFEEYTSSYRIGEIAPLATEAFKEGIKNRPQKKGLKELKGKSVTQRVLDIQVHFQKNGIIASFDKFLRIEGTPFVITTQVAFKLRQGRASSWNPLGIYVDGIIEHEKIP